MRILLPHAYVDSQNLEKFHRGQIWNSAGQLIIPKVSVWIGYVGFVNSQKKKKKKPKKKNKDNNFRGK
jgi:hypothetical protein